MEVFLNYIREQFELENFQILQSDGYFELENRNLEVVYFEDNFTSEDSFVEDDIQELMKMARDEDHVPHHNFSYFKNWYLITHEKYFIKDIKLDKYDRIGIDNLISEFHEILKVPMADILKVKFLEKINIKKVKKTNFYLTCDFDQFNAWDAWGFKDFIREIVCSIRDLKFKKLKETILSYFFARKFEKFNYYLNDRMFSYDDLFHNLGFFITSEKSGIDGKFEYDNRQVKKYIQRLRDNHVEFGLHTSFYTYDEPETIFEQQSKFKDVFGIYPLINRHHYLRFIFPDYLENLEKIGIKKDFSLYFPENTIFRCGTSSKFRPWNEKESRPYDLELYPITLMDGTFTDYLHCSFEEAKRLAMHKINLSIKYSTDIVLLWHNRSTYKNCNIQNNYHPELIAYLKENIKKKAEFRH